MDPSLLMHMEENIWFSCFNQCQSGAGPASTLRSISSRSTLNVSNMRLVDSFSSIRILSITQALSLYNSAAYLMPGLRLERNIRPV